MSGSLTCEPIDWVEGRKLPGPADDLVMREAMACGHIPLLFSPSQRTDLQLESLGVVYAIFVHNQKIIICKNLRLEHLWVCVGRSDTSPRLCVPDSQHAIFPSPARSDRLSLPWTPSHRLNTQNTMNTQEYKQWCAGSVIVWTVNSWIGSTDNISPTRIKLLKFAQTKSTLRTRGHVFLQQNN